MEPYYEQDNITIYHGDCREVLPLIDPVDLVLTDPPYGIGMLAFADVFEIVPPALNTAKAGLLAVFMSPRRIDNLIDGVRTSWTFERLLWMHKRADIAMPWRGWCMNSEAIVLFSRQSAVWPKPTDYRSDVYEVGPWERAGHPNGKPLAVVRDIARRLTDGTILDPFMAIGIELEERYCEMAANRLAQGVLFGAQSA